MSFVANIILVVFVAGASENEDQRIELVSTNKQALREMNRIKFDHRVKNREKLDLTTQRFYKWIFQIQPDVDIDKDACDVVERVMELWAYSSRSFNQAFDLFMDLKCHQNERMRRLILNVKCGQILFKGAVNHGTKQQANVIFDYFAVANRMNVISNEAIWQILHSKLYLHEARKYFDHWLDHVSERPPCNDHYRVSDERIVNRVLQMLMEIPNRYPAIMELIEEANEMKEASEKDVKLLNLDSYKIVFEMLELEMEKNPTKALAYVADACKQYRCFLESKLDDPGKEMVQALARILYLGEREPQSIINIIDAIEQDVADNAEQEQARETEDVQGCAYDS